MQRMRTLGFMKYSQRQPERLTGQISQRRFVGIHGWRLAGLRALCVEGFFNPPAAGLHFLAFLEVAAKPLVSLRAILKTLEIGLEFDGRFEGRL